MTHLTVRDFEPVDFLSIEVDPRVAFGRAGQPVDAWAQYHKAVGYSFTVVDPQDALVFCAGVHHIWDGLGEVWGVFSPLARRYPHTLRCASRLLDMVILDGDYQRVQCAVNPAWPEAVRFIEHLGFSRECIMEKYGPNGVDHALYARIEKGA